MHTARRKIQGTKLGSDNRRVRDVDVAGPKDMDRVCARRRLWIHTASECSASQMDCNEPWVYRITYIFMRLISKREKSGERSRGKTTTDNE